MAKSTQSLHKQAKNDRDITIALAQLARLSDAYGVLTNQLQELAMAQMHVSATAQEARNYVREAAQTTVAALDEFDARIKVLEEKLGVGTPILDNEGEAP